MNKEELCLFNHKQNKNKCSKNEEMIKYNKTRTRLLLLVNLECSRYIKNSNVRFNSELPREINRHYEESCTISFSNPIVTSFPNKNVIQCVKRAESNVPIVTADKLDLLNLSSNQSVSDFGKCLNDFGKEFINKRKISISNKKLDISKIYNLDPLQLDKITNSESSNNVCYTGQSLMQVVNQLNMMSSVSTGKNPQKNIKKRKFIFPGENRSRLEEMIRDEKKREAKRTQEKFNKLQNLANKLKNTGGITKINLENKELKNSAKFNGELSDILKFKGLNFESEIIQENSKYKKDLETVFKENTGEKQEKIITKEDKYFMQHFPSESERISDHILKNIPVKKSENVISNPFSKAANKALNPIGDFHRRDVRNKPISRTTKESGKLTAIIMKIRENLFKTNQLNCEHSSQSITQVKKDTKKIKNIPLRKTKTPFTNYNSNKNSTRTQSKQNFYETTNFQEEYEIDIKQLLDSSVGNLSDSENHSRASLCANLNRDRSPFENFSNNLKKGNLLTQINSRHKRKYPNKHNSNRSNNSEVSRHSNSFSDSISCSVISNDDSNITPLSISDSEFSNELDCE